MKAPRLLRHYLLRWTLGMLLILWLAVVAQAWTTAFREARKFSDGQMVAVARLWLLASPIGGVDGLLRLDGSRSGPSTRCLNIAIAM